MLTVEQARDIANVWRPKFSEEDAFNTSWSRYMDMVKDQSPGSLETWLETDQQRDAVKAAGIVHEPLLPTRQESPVGCWHCHYNGFVRMTGWSPDPSECGPDHPAFGKAMRCPACSNPNHHCEKCA